MSKGIAAFVIVMAVIMSISVLSGIGYYNSLNIDYSNQGYNEDVQAAADAMTSQSASNTGASVYTDFTVGAGNTLATAWQVLSNTSGVIQLLFNAPKILADTLQTLFQITFGISFAGFVRGVMIG